MPAPFMSSRQPVDFPEFPRLPQKRRKWTTLEK